MEERSRWLGVDGPEKSCTAGHLLLNLGRYMHAQCPVLPSGHESRKPPGQGRSSGLKVKRLETQTLRCFVTYFSSPNLSGPWDLPYPPNILPQKNTVNNTKLFTKIKTKETPFTS